jgi:hypothetical protein
MVISATASNAATSETTFKLILKDSLLVNNLGSRSISE